MRLLGELIAAEYAEWDGSGRLEEELFGTRDPEAIAGHVDRFCSRRLGSPIERYEFFATSALSVHGARLEDGRRVVVKVGRRRLGASFLQAVQNVQSRLAAGGFPCPRPLFPPTRLERGLAVVEELLDRGSRSDAHRPPVRRALASSLARLVRLCRGFATPDELPRSALAAPSGDELWPEPHDLRFDFPATASGAEWIDELAQAARQALAVPAGDTVVGHTDWRAEHVRFDGDEIVAVYDWQSLAVAPEPALVGTVGHAFTADWSIPQPRRLPSLVEFRAFVTDYEAALGRTFSSREREAIDAAWVYAIAYGARCEHSDVGKGFPWAEPEPGEHSYRGLLARHGAALLTR